jgi:hypothetical protein
MVRRQSNESGAWQAEAEQLQRRATLNALRMETRAAQPVTQLRWRKFVVRRKSARRPLLLPGALFVAVGAQLFAAFMLIDLCFASLFK